MTAWFLAEAQALLARLRLVKPFSLNMPMVAAAGIEATAQRGIEALLRTGKGELQAHVRGFIELARSENASPEHLQRRFSLLKLRFNALLDQLDIFADVLAQRGEHDTGIFVAGLDALARDALRPVAPWVEMPPLVCFLERGHGAAIRRARTRLPGGKPNPVGVIQVPRERMISNGIASSLVHEVGHQVAALLDILPMLRVELRRRALLEPARRRAWLLLERWCSEIVSDAWSVGLIGIGATTGLIGVVGLPRYFVFRVTTDGPHPFPWVRVMLSLAIGQRIYPHPQWQVLLDRWQRFYPPGKEAPDKQVLLRELTDVLPDFTDLLLGLRPGRLKGRSFGQLFPVHERRPMDLQRLFSQWKSNPALLARQSPGLVFAVLGQARFDQKLHPDREQELLEYCLRHWATTMF